MPRYQLTPQAREDLRGIKAYSTKQWGAQQARCYLSHLRDTVRSLSEHPQAGTHRPDLGEGIFSFPHVRHMIYYSLAEPDQTVVVMAFLHQSKVPILHLERS